MIQHDVGFQVYLEGVMLKHMALLSKTLKRQEVRLIAHGQVLSEDLTQPGL